MHSLSSTIPQRIVHCCHQGWYTGRLVQCWMDGSKMLPYIVYRSSRRVQQNPPFGVRNECIYHGSETWAEWEWKASAIHSLQQMSLRVAHTLTLHTLQHSNSSHIIPNKRLHQFIRHRACLRTFTWQTLSELFSVDFIESQPKQMDRTHAQRHSKQASNWLAWRPVNFC